MDLVTAQRPPLQTVSQGQRGDSAMHSPGISFLLSAWDRRQGQEGRRGWSRPPVLRACSCGPPVCRVPCSPSSHPPRQSFPAVRDGVQGGGGTHVAHRPETQLFEAACTEPSRWQRVSHWCISQASLHCSEADDGSYSYPLSHPEPSDRADCACEALAVMLPLPCPAMIPASESLWV